MTLNRKIRLCVIALGFVCVMLLGYPGEMQDTRMLWRWIVFIVWNIPAFTILLVQVLKPQVHWYSDSVNFIIMFTTLIWLLFIGL